MQKNSEILEEVYSYSNKKLKSKIPDFVRSFINKIDWNEKLIAIKGARGIGKSTILLQKLKSLKLPANKAIYIPLDQLIFLEIKLHVLAAEFYKNGGRYLFLDEVHKYPYDTWSIELKNIYDTYDDLKVVFSGSSALEILKGRADLSRRAVIYNMQGLSFREYLNISGNLKINTIYSLKDILKNHVEIADELLNTFSPFEHFQTYLENGYYPYFTEGLNHYYDKMYQTVQYVIEAEMISMFSVKAINFNKIKRLLYVIAKEVPFDVNLSKLSSDIGISKNTVLNFLNYLDKLGLIKNLYSSNIGKTKLNKPVKIYLENTNLSKGLNVEIPNIGTIRETFVCNQLKAKHEIAIPKKGDFLVDEKYLLEVGGKSKNQKQIINEEEGYLIIDRLEIGSYNRIPIWLFGFLY